MSRLLFFLVFFGVVFSANGFSYGRNLLNVFRDSGCKTQFNTDNEMNHLPNGEGVLHCFRNHVSCIDYSVNVQKPGGSEDEDIPKLLVVIAEKQSVNNDNEDDNELENYLEDTVCRNYTCDKRINVDSNKHYAVIVINANYTDPPFDDASGQDVTYMLDLRGCLTTAQKLVIVLVVVGTILAVCGCLSCIIVYFRRNSRLTAAQQATSYTYNGGGGKVLQMTSAQPAHAISPTFSASTQATNFSGIPAGVHGHTQSAIPWAAPVSPSTQGSGAPRF